MNVEVKVMRVGARGAPLPLPAYQTEASAGLDLHDDLEGAFELAPGGRTLVPTGLAIALPPGFEAQVRPRSGLALKHGLTLPNAPGTIDADYRGEVKVIVQNLGDEAVRIERGMRIAQLVVAPVARATLTLVDDLPETERGAGGFGHSGT